MHTDFGLAELIHRMLRLQVGTWDLASSGTGMTLLPPSRTVPSLTAAAVAAAGNL